MPTALITGANRGIGLELVRQYAADGFSVIATCRDPGAAGDLGAVPGEVETHALDVDDADGVAAVAEKLRGRPIDVLFNNAGINIDKASSIGGIDYAAWERTMRTNLLAPIRLAWAVKDNVAASTTRVMAFTGSRMGSIALNTGGNAVYRSSKTALNMAAHCLSLELKDQGVIVVCLHPGHVSTDMGGPGAPVTPRDSVAGMRAVIASLTVADTGCFRNYDGAQFPW